jgi:hypothetical protein
MQLPANFRTTLTGIGAAVFSLLTILAALPYETGALANIFPIEWKPKIFAASAIAAVILKIWNSVVMKDKAVTGGKVQQTLTGAVADPGTQTLVDETVKASIASGEHVSEEDRRAVSKGNNP